jgi:hypothetical protein
MTVQPSNPSHTAFPPLASKVSLARRKEAMQIDFADQTPRSPFFLHSFSSRSRPLQTRKLNSLQIAIGIVDICGAG